MFTFAGVYGSKCFAEIPPPPDTTSNGGFGHPGQHRPLFEGPSNFLECKEPSVTSVSGLLFRGGPPAILRIVPKVVVNPIQRKAGRAGSHVARKYGESCVALPLITDSDSSSPVSSKGFMTRVVTSGIHRRPHFVYRCVAESVCSVNTSLFTAAGCLRAASKCSRSSLAHGTATADAFPQSVFSQVSAQRYYCKSPEDEPGKVEGTGDILLFRGAATRRCTATYEVPPNDEYKITARAQTKPYTFAIFCRTFTLQCCELSKFVVREVSRCRHVFLQSCVYGIQYSMFVAKIKGT